MPRKPLKLPKVVTADTRVWLHLTDDSLVLSDAKRNRRIALGVFV